MQIQIGVAASKTLTRHSSGANDEIEFFLCCVFNRHVCYNLKKTRKIMNGGAHNEPWIRVGRCAF